MRFRRNKYSFNKFFNNAQRKTYTFAISENHTFAHPSEKPFSSLIHTTKGEYTMHEYTVFTSDGRVFPNVWAESAGHAERIVSRICLGRTGTMTSRRTR